MERCFPIARAVCAAVVAFDLAFVAPSWLTVRLFWYAPLLHRWELTLKPEALSMDWYGRLLIATGAALVVFLLARCVRHERVPSESLMLWSGWAVIATALSLGLQVSTFAARHPNPEPLPSWYVPR